MERWCDYATELRGLCASITAWGALEPQQSLEHATLHAITTVSEQVSLWVLQCRNGLLRILFGCSLTFISDL